MVNVCEDKTASPSSIFIFWKRAPELLLLLSKDDVSNYSNRVVLPNYIYESHIVLRAALRQ